MKIEDPQTNYPSTAKEISNKLKNLCNFRNWSPPGSSVHGILQAKILEWVTVPFSRVTSQPRD